MNKKITLPVPHAVGICEECAQNNTYKKDDEFVSYCDHSRTGGLYVQGIWMLYTPVSREVFAQLILPQAERFKTFGSC
jgi:hypothetical protein